MIQTPNRKLNIPERKDLASIVEALTTSMQTLDKWDNPIDIPYTNSGATSVQNIKDALDTLFTNHATLTKNLSDGLTQIRTDLTNGTLKPKNATNADVAASANAVTWANVTGKPSTFTPASHNHSATEITSGTLATAHGGTGNTHGTANPTVTYITSGTVTLSDYKAAGIYAFAQNCTITDIPTGVNGWLIVFPYNWGATTAKQIWTRWGTVDSNDWETFIREVTASQVGKWRRIFTAGDVVPIANGGTGNTKGTAVWG